MLQCARGLRDLLGGPQRHRRGSAAPGETLLAESVSRLWLDGGEVAERALTIGKVQNLRLAARRIDGAVVPAGTTFSFWKQVGRATRRAGFVDGRELREGCVIPSVGGGLCQLSNALYDAALRARFEIVERHAHSAVVPGSLAAAGRDATIFWNYVDLRFRPPRDIRIDVSMTADALAVRFWGRGEAALAPAGAVPEDAERDGAGAAPDARPVPTGDCASCAVEACFRHVALHRGPSSAERTAFVVDTWWPELDAYVSEVARPNDVLFVPLDGQRRGIAQYGWNTAPFRNVRESIALAVLRGVASRRVARQGAARQRLLLDWAHRISESAAARLPYDVTHVVVAQPLLPALWAGGHLGGRTYDVLMTALPMRALQATLDRAAALHPESRTLADYRADATLLDVEERALAGARTLVTPHAAIASLFGPRAVRLPWAVADGPPGERRAKAEPKLVFPASTLGRAGAYELRAAARELGVTVVLTGPDLEGEGFWEGVRIERAPFERAFLGASAVVLPAFVEHQPRRLLQAAALGVPVVASEACGIDASAAVTVVQAGDVSELRSAIVSALAAPVLV